MWSSAQRNNAGALATVGSLDNVVPASASETAFNSTLNFLLASVCCAL